MSEEPSKKKTPLTLILGEEAPLRRGENTPPASAGLPGSPVRARSSAPPQRSLPPIDRRDIFTREQMIEAVSGAIAYANADADQRIQEIERRATEDRARWQQQMDQLRAVHMRKYTGLSALVGSLRSQVHHACTLVREALEHEENPLLQRRVEQIEAILRNRFAGELEADPIVELFAELELLANDEQAEECEAFLEHGHVPPRIVELLKLLFIQA